MVREVSFELVEGHVITTGKVAAAGFDGAKLGVGERFNVARNGSPGCGAVRGFRHAGSVLPVRNLVQVVEVFPEPRVKVG
jgi:hypothetical protein